MAIPLIQNVEKQDINTSIIAIKKELQTLQDKETAVDIDLSDYVKKDDVADVVEADNLNPVTSNAVAQALEDLPQYGTPLGTWASFENDYAPNIEWLQGGTTFNPNTYPALAMYLGGNTVPERFDHNRLGELETLDVSLIGTTEGTAWVAPYDGVLNISINVSGVSGQHYFYARHNNTENAFATQGGNGGMASNIIELKKGDKIWSTVKTSQCHFQVRYYKHPLFIKATPTSSDSDYEGTLNAIREFYVRNNTYSTEERLTGGVWIDGKKIYRKVIDLTNVSNGTVLLSDVEMVIDSGGMQKDSSTNNQYQAFPHPYASYNQQWRLNTSNQVVALFTRTDTSGYCWFEYTKTTD